MEQLQAATSNLPQDTSQDFDHKPSTQGKAG